LERELTVNNSLMPGMYVRVPLEIDRQDSEFRDFKLGQIQSINDIANTALVCLHESGEDDLQEIECSLDYLHRCRILPDTNFMVHDEERKGRLLIHCDDEWSRGKFLEYYVLFDNEKIVTRISEERIVVTPNRQNPDPYEQLLAYEFQNPIWKFNRDRLVESYNELHNATFGIEELVGARLMLLSHQAEVVARVLADASCRYILADEVGLGKTIEACVILKGLIRRSPSLTTLIITPSSLVKQWQNELSAKFWLDIPIAHSIKQVQLQTQPVRYIIASEDIAEDTALWKALSKQSLGLLIIDEAHHIHKSPTLYSHIRELSAISKHALVLSATPIQRRAQEYFALLSIMNPHKYNSSNASAFEDLVRTQGKIRRRIAVIARSLTSNAFDAEEFEDEMKSVLSSLRHDRLLAKLVETVTEQANSQDGGLTAAKEALAYVSENYRIEARVIRNRRSHLQVELPERMLDSSYSYEPSKRENAALDNLYDYIDKYVAEFPDHPLSLEYGRLLMYAASSSPQALLDVLEIRIAHTITQNALIPSHFNLSIPAAPRQEAKRIQYLIESMPIFNNEKEQYLNSLQYSVEQWLNETEQELEQVTRMHFTELHKSSHRLVQVLYAISRAITNSATEKVVIFSGWPQTLETLLPCLLQQYGKSAVTEFTSNLDNEQLQDNVDFFQSSSRCRILLCDELGGEGRNFQIASQIIHVDLPWTPGQLEQRIGRVDRLGRTGTVLSIVPFAVGWPEQDLFNIWQSAFQLFTRSMSGLEIAMEGIQNALVATIKESSRNGLAELLTPMIERADKLREAVEEERYYEGVAVNHSRRKEFEDISEKYRDGSLLRIASLRWASLAGLHQEYDSSTDQITFNPKEFSPTSMKKVKFAQPPNMEEALRRSKRKHDLVIRGTFNRDIAVRREDIVFFAPGSDPWTDAIINNAIEADRGRCCAILRKVPLLKGTWRGFELRYSLNVDPRPLYSAGFDPTLIFRAFGFLRSSKKRLLISDQGVRERSGSIVWKGSEQEFNKSQDIHLGKREGAIQQISSFKESYPADTWNILLKQTFVIAHQVLSEELDEYMDEVAEEAREVFDRQILGLKAAYRWQRHYANDLSGLDEKEIKEYEHVSEALIAGIRHPMLQLESVCYWILQGSNQ